MVELTAASILKNGNTAVITGASSGIGRSAAMYCASKGMNVWLVDIDATELEEAKQAVANAGKKEYPQQKIESMVVDVSNHEQVNALADTVFANGGKCHFLMNNAGTGLGGGAMTDMDTVQRVMGVNTYGPINACLAFVSRMKEPGIIVNTGSKQGITMPPGNLTYNMSKAALKTYTEGLEHELRQDSNRTLRAALLVPGWVNTSIVKKTMRDNAAAKGETFDESTVPFHEGDPAKGAWMPSQVVEYMVQELDKGRFYIICPDNDVDRTTDNLRMTWTMQDITQDRPPLSRWHPEYKEQFTAFLEANKTF